MLKIRMTALRGVWLKSPLICFVHLVLTAALIGCGDENMPRAGIAEVHLDVFLDFTEIEERGDAILGRPSDEFRTLVSEYATAETLAPTEQTAERSRIVDALQADRTYTRLVDLLDRAGVPTEFVRAGAFSAAEAGASDANAATVRFFPLYDAVLAPAPVQVSVGPQPASQTAVVRQNTVRRFLLFEVLPAYIRFFDSVTIDTSLPMDTFPQTHLVEPLCRYFEGMSDRTFGVVGNYPGQVSPKLRIQIYSDLVEHSPNFSFYRDEGMEDSVIVERFMTLCSNAAIDAAVAQRTQIRTQSQPVVPPAPNDPNWDEKYAKFQDDESRILRAEGVWIRFFEQLGLERVGQFR